MATPDLRKQIGKNRPQTTTRCEIPITVDCTKTPLASGDVATVHDTPKGFVLEHMVALLLAAEGGAGTIDVGDATDPDGLLDGGSVNGTPGAAIALAGTEAYGLGKVLSEKAIIVTANAALDGAKFKLILLGYIDKDIS